MQEMLEGEDSSDITFDEQLETKVPDKKKTKKCDISNIFFSKQSLKKLDPNDMLKMLHNNEEAKANKPTEEFYINENPKIPSKKVEIINKLKELYQLRGTSYLNKLNNDLKKINI